MTSHAVSRGRLASLVGKRFAAGGLRVYFARIHSLFAFILLTYNMIQDHDYVLYLCGVHWASCGRLVLFFIIQKKGKRRKLWLNAFSCKQWGCRSLNNYQPWL